MSGHRSSDPCRAPSTSRRSSGPSTLPVTGRRPDSAIMYTPSPLRRPSKIPLSTSVKIDHRLPRGVLQPHDVAEPLDAPGGDVLGERQRRGAARLKLEFQALCRPVLENHDAGLAAFGLQKMAGCDLLIGYLPSSFNKTTCCVKACQKDIVSRYGPLNSCEVSRKIIVNGP